MKILRRSDVTISLSQSQDLLELELILDLSHYGFDSKSKVFLDVYDRYHLFKIDLGNAEEFTERKIICEQLPFVGIPERRKMRFRFKVVDPKTSRLLGYIEHIRESGHAESLLQMELTDEIKGVFKIDWDADHPIIYVNKKLENCLESMAPLIAESAFKEIAMTFFENKDEFDDEILEENEWGKLFTSYSDRSLKELREISWADRVEKINDMAHRYSLKMKLVDKILTLDKKRN